MDEKPIMSLRLAGAATGAGAAKVAPEAFDVMSGFPKAEDCGAAVCPAGVADWKSSKSSSSLAAAAGAVVVDSAARPEPLEGAAGAAEDEEGTGSSNENKSTSGSFFFGGSTAAGAGVVFLVPARSVVLRRAGSGAS